MSENIVPQKDGFLPYPKGFATAAIHHSQEPEQWDSMAIVAPIVTSCTYKLQPGEKKYIYSRDANPTRQVLENVLAKLDNAKWGLAFSSGLGAIMAAMGLLNSGDHMICGDDIFGGTNRLFNKVVVNFGIEITPVNLTDLQIFENTIKTNTKLVFFEIPTNPTMQVADLAAVTGIAKKHNLIVIVDNTFLTPYLLRPLNFGVDVVHYSLTKYMNGHSDLIMGALVTSNEEIYKKLKLMQNSMGIVPSPFDCYQVNRGLKTLALRMERHKRNSLEIAKYLSNHPKVEKVLHPSLPSHPQHELFKKQTSGHSGTFSFYINGDLETSKKFINAVKIFAPAGSLGGCESLIQIPSIISHSSVPLKDKIKLGITDSLIRLSVGIEDVEDLIADLEQAFNKI